MVYIVSNDIYNDVCVCLCVCENIYRISKPFIRSKILRVLNVSMVSYIVGHTKVHRQSFAVMVILRNRECDFSPLSEISCQWIFGQNSALLGFSIMLSQCQETDVFFSLYYQWSVCPVLRLVVCLFGHTPHAGQTFEHPSGRVIKFASICLRALLAKAIQI